MNMDRVRITVTFDIETYKLLKNISDKNHISISETVRRYTEAGLNGSLSESNINYISAIIREQLRIVMQPSIERLAALSAKTCIQASAAAYLTAEAIARFVPVELQEDVAAVYEDARKAEFRMRNNYMNDNQELILKGRYTAYMEQIEKYYNGTIDRTQPIVIGMTTNALAISGADSSLELTINIKTLNKCIGSPDDIYHGHLLDRNIIEQFPFQLENPVMIFKNTEKHSLICITDLQDSSGHGVMIAVALEQVNKQHMVNRISSLYGKDHIYNYISSQLAQNNLIAENKEKADMMLQSRGLQLPKEETYISYDDSIPYSVDNVKQILNSDKYKNSLSHFLSDLESNCFNQTEKLINNYKQLLYYKKYHNATLDDISKEYITGSQNPYINAIGNELKEQELVRCDDVAATLEP